MATVYLAIDLRHERQVAVKVLRPDLSASIGSDRFLQEIRIAARLSHPHILPLHDSGEAAGLLYYVMPYVPGESLRQRITREGELPVPDAVRILRDVTDALSHAREHGVVHRDIKPENILISGRHALVADFGVARAVSEATGRSKLTTAGVAHGAVLPGARADGRGSACSHSEPRRLLAPNRRVCIDSDAGAITVVIHKDRAPITSVDFLRYVEEKRYDGGAFSGRHVVEPACERNTRRGGR